MKTERDINLLYEIGTMRHISRTWTQFGGLSLANLAEHTLRVIWLALIIAKSENADINKVIKLALIHDVPETRTGDVNYLSRMYTSRDENTAINDFAKNTSIQEEIISLWNEFEKMDTIEAQIVKDADSLDCDLELQEQEAAGNSLKKHLAEARTAAANKLRTVTARRLYQAILLSDPHAWHAQTRNRANSGDWSQ